MIIACPSCRSIGIVTAGSRFAPLLCVNWKCVESPRVITDEAEAVALVRAALLGHDYSLTSNPLPEPRR